MSDNYNEFNEFEQNEISSGSSSDYEQNDNSIEIKSEEKQEFIPIVDEITSDSDYLTNIQKNSSEFYNTSYKPSKKKKSISIPAFIASIVATLVVSALGVTFAYNYDEIMNASKSYMNGLKNSVTVEDNINASENIVKGTQTNVTIAGEPLTTPEIVDKVGPAVVGIVNKTTFGNAYGYFGFFGSGVDEEIEQGSGSGVIISQDGYIVTNNHVVDKATKIMVILNNGDEYEGRVVGKDASTDLAVVKIEATGLTYAQMGTSSTLRVGERAIAIGNPLGQEFAGTTTQGIISGLNRSVTIDNKVLNLIQTDAAINPGNSGGALVDEYGHLIGINTAKISSTTLEGLGFAIPIDEAKPIIEELITNGYVTGRPVIGIAGRAVTSEDAKAYKLKVGVYVSSLTPNGPAHMAGIQIGDIITECEGEPIETVDDINEIKNKKSPGDMISFKVYRRGYSHNIQLILGEENPTTAQ